MFGLNSTVGPTKAKVDSTVTNAAKKKKVVNLMGGILYIAWMVVRISFRTRVSAFAQTAFHVCISFSALFPVSSLFCCQYTKKALFFLNTVLHDVHKLGMQCKKEIMIRIIYVKIT
jgi:hypothetical protein